MLVRPAAFAFATTVATSTSSRAQLVIQIPLPVMASRLLAFARGASVLGRAASDTAGAPSGRGVHDDGCFFGTGQPACGGVGAAAFAGSAPGTAGLGLGVGFGLGTTGPIVACVAWGDGLGVVTSATVATSAGVPAYEVLIKAPTRTVPAAVARRRSARVSTLSILGAGGRCCSQSGRIAGW